MTVNAFWLKCRFDFVSRFCFNDWLEVLVCNVRTPEDIGKLPGEKAVKVRNELYEDIGIIVYESR